MFINDLFDAIKRVCPKALTTRDGGNNPVVGAIPNWSRSSDGERWSAIVAYAAAVGFVHAPAENDDWALIKTAFTMIEQRGFIDFEDYHTDEEVAIRAKKIAAKERKEAAHQKYRDSLKLLILTEEQKAALRSPSFKFTRIGEPVISMMDYLPASHPEMLFSYQDFGATWASSATQDCRILNSMIRNGIVEVVEPGHTLGAKVKLGPNYEKAAKRFGVKDGSKSWIRTKHFRQQS